jgi:hypothetical protein
LIPQGTKAGLTFAKQAGYMPVRGYLAMWNFLNSRIDCGKPSGGFFAAMWHLWHVRVSVKFLMEGGGIVVSNYRVVRV